MSITKYRQNVMDRAVDIAKISYHGLLTHGPEAGPGWEDLPEGEIRSCSKAFEKTAEEDLSFTAGRIREIMNKYMPSPLVERLLITQGLIPDPAEQDGTATTHIVSFSMDGLRRQMATSFNELVFALHANMEGDYVRVPTEVLQAPMDELRENIGSLHCAHMDGVKHFTNLSDQAPRIKWFNNPEPDPDNQEDDL